MSDQVQEQQDDRVLELREKRRSFAAIAQIVGYDRTSEAPAAFNRALRRRPPKEQAAVRDAELARLDSMAQRVRENKELTAADAARRLGVVDRLRARLLAP
jgi:AraC-like DNA-binding protein